MKKRFIWLAVIFWLIPIDGAFRRSLQALTPIYFYIACSGPVESYDPSTLYGYAGRHLTAAGETYAQELVDSLVDIPIGTIYCSSRQGAQETADIIAGLVANAPVPVVLDDRLRPRDMGCATGVTDWDAYLAAHPEYTVESVQSYVARVLSFIRDRIFQGDMSIFVVVHPCLVYHLYDAGGISAFVKPTINRNDPARVVYSFVYYPVLNRVSYLGTIPESA